MKNRKTLKQLILGSLLLLSTNSLFAQTQKVQTLQAKNSTTIATMNSDALIQMDSDNKGLLLPRIALTGANKVAPLTAHTAGMVVYNTATVAATATIEAVTPGYYYNNGTKWVKIANTDTADITNDAWVNNTTTNVVELGAKSDGTTRTAGSEVRIDDNGTIIAGPNTFDSLGVPAGNILRNSFFLATGKNGDSESMFNFAKYGYLDVAAYYNLSAYGEPRIQLNKNRGTVLNPQPVQNGDFLGQLNFTGRRSSDVDDINGTFVASAVDNTIVAGKKLPAKLGFWTANDDLTGFEERMTIRSSGNVGIGTITPAEQFVVSNADTDPVNGKNPSIVSESRGIFNPTLTLYHQPNNNIFLLDQNTGVGDASLAGDVRFSMHDGTLGSLPYTNRVDVMILKKGGNVGINTHTPRGKLEVNGGIRAKKAPVGTTITNTTDFGYSFEQDGDTGMFAIGGTAASTSDLHFKKDGTTAIFIAGSGANSDNVGIATTTPTEKLEVAGKVKATGFMVGTTNLTVPDYVFEKYYEGFSKLNNNYIFRALPEVEAFIKKNGHLPGYVSAKEVAKAKSFDMTATQLINIEKIEELYLHTIEQDKKLKAQNKRIEKLEALVTKLMEAKK